MSRRNGSIYSRSQKVYYFMFLLLGRHLIQTKIEIDMKLYRGIILIEYWRGNYYGEIDFEESDVVTCYIIYAFIICETINCKVQFSLPTTVTY